MTDLTLARFLLARIAEDEARAKAAQQPPDPGRWEVSRDPLAAEYMQVLGQFHRAERPPHPDAERFGGGHWYAVTPAWDAAEGPWPEHFAAHISRHDPARILAECAAKRRIVEAWQEDICLAGGVGDVEREEGRKWGLEVAIMHLAAIYADHPDYRQEWKP